MHQDCDVAQSGRAHLPADRVVGVVVSFFVFVFVGFLHAFLNVGHGALQIEVQGLFDEVVKDLRVASDQIGDFRGVGLYDVGEGGNRVLDDLGNDFRTSVDIFMRDQYFDSQHADLLGPRLHFWVHSLYHMAQTHHTIAQLLQSIFILVGGVMADETEDSVLFLVEQELKIITVEDEADLLKSPIRFPYKNKLVAELNIFEEVLNEAPAVELDLRTASHVGPLSCEFGHHVQEQHLDFWFAAAGHHQLIDTFHKQV